MRVRLSETYPNWYWNSGSGVTIKKEDREGIEADENDRMVKIALEQGFLEIVTPEELEKVRAEKKESKIMTDVPDTKKSMKEVVTMENTEKMNEVKEEIKEEPVETSVEETPKEEAPVEEKPAEEKPAEEPKTE